MENVKNFGRAFLYKFISKLNEDNNSLREYIENQFKIGDIKTVDDLKKVW